MKITTCGFNPNRLVSVGSSRVSWEFLTLLVKDVLSSEPSCLVLYTKDFNQTGWLQNRVRVVSRFSEKIFMRRLSSGRYTLDLGSLFSKQGKLFPLVYTCIPGNVVVVRSLWYFLNRRSQTSSFFLSTNNVTFSLCRERNLEFPILCVVFCLDIFVDTVFVVVSYSILSTSTSRQN